MPEWMPSLGAIVAGGRTAFRVWAPDHASIELALERERAGPEFRALTRDEDGVWTGAFDDIRAGDRYRYRIDKDDGKIFPDPASRFQPDGVHGASQVVDPSRFTWTDRHWTPPALHDVVFYELHVGTFSPAGTYQGAIAFLPRLVQLGVTAIELMPVADFPGSRNWGYDGVALFAPSRQYGTPDDLRALVDAAHALGLAVFLDVVYNHLGPDGAYANAFSRHYFTDLHRSPWGLGVNLDGPMSREVRRFFIENALHWVTEYHVDGLRLDATHAIQDDSETHFLAELSSTVRARSGRRVLLVAEDHRNLTRLLRPAAEGGFGLDAVWADDFHHQVRVHVAGDREGYYADFSGSTADLAATITQGWFFTGQHSSHLGHHRGTDPLGLEPEQFVVCIQNHDQIGNRADGARLNHEIDAATYRAVSVLLALTPHTPLLFMGQEWGASTPFLFFTDHHAELGRLVTEGRRKEFSSFEAFRDPARRAAIPDPQAAATFEASRLQWDERSGQPHAGILRLYERLLALRRASGLWQPMRRAAYEVTAPDAETIVISFFGSTAAVTGPSAAAVPALVVVVQLAGAGMAVAPLAHERSEVAITTEDPDIVQDARPARLIASDTSATRGQVAVHFERPGAVVLRPLRP